MGHHQQRASQLLKRRGHAVVEVALLSPWIFLLFIGILDFGFYAYTTISVENATRVGALYASYTWGSAQDNVGTCSYVLEELRKMSNVGTSLTTCTSAPVVVNALRYDGTTLPAGWIGPACPSIASSPRCTQVQVTYTTVPLIPIPGLMGKMTLTRTVQMRVR